jgi:hypothetical protein
MSVIYLPSLKEGFVTGHGDSLKKDVTDVTGVTVLIN